MNKQSSRRFFLKSSTLAGIASVVGHQMIADNLSKYPGAEKGLTILFQGDSITDGNRGRNEDPNHIMGHG